MNPLYEAVFGSDPVTKPYRVAEAIERGVHVGVLDRGAALLCEYELQGGQRPMPRAFDEWLQSRAMREMAQKHIDGAVTTRELTPAEAWRAVEYIANIAVGEGILDPDTVLSCGYEMLGGTVPMPPVFDEWFGTYRLDVHAGERTYDPDVLPRTREKRRQEAREAARAVRPRAIDVEMWEQLAKSAELVSRYLGFPDAIGPDGRPQDVATLLGLIDSIELMAGSLRTHLGGVITDAYSRPAH